MATICRSHQFAMNEIKNRRNKLIEIIIIMWILRNHFAGRLSIDIHRPFITGAAHRMADAMRLH